jgi:hypothetical protein
MAASEGLYLRRVLQAQKNATELLFVAVILAVGLNVFSNAVPQYLSIDNAGALKIGISLCFLSIAYAAYRLTSLLRISVTLDGLLALREHNEVMAINGYRFSESTAKHLRGLCTENKALDAVWRNASLGISFGEMSASDQHNARLGRQLAIEAIEYFVLDELSLHLSSYFNSDCNSSNRIISKIQRSDIPGLLLQNHFLEQFSKPMSERQAFLHIPLDYTRTSTMVIGGAAQTAGKSRVVSAYGKNGEIFDHFELILPRGSSLRRTREGLRISTPRYSLCFSTKFNGFDTNLPKGFEELYLEVPFHSLSPKEASLCVFVNFNWWAFLWPGGWDHYKWLDAFIERLDHGFSFDVYLQDIQWQAAHTVATVLRRSFNSRAIPG